MKHCLEADSIIFELGSRKILSDIYMQFATGEINGLLGRNGVGKSCLMKIIYGTLDPLNKSIRMDGKAIHYPFKSPEILTYLPQFNFIPKKLNIKNVFADFKLDSEELLSYFPNFSGRINSALGRFSGGERRLIEVYTIIKSDSMFSMLDEPFTLLMPLHIEIIKKLLNKEKVKKGFLITDHLYEQIMDICDQIYLLQNGQTYPAMAPDLAKYTYFSLSKGTP